MKEYRFILGGYTRRSNKGIHILNIGIDGLGHEKADNKGCMDSSLAGKEKLACDKLLGPE